MYVTICIYSTYLYIYNGILYYAALKEKEIMSFATTFPQGNGSVFTNSVFVLIL